MIEVLIEARVQKAVEQDRWLRGFRATLIAVSPETLSPDQRILRDAYLRSSRDDGLLSPEELHRVFEESREANRSEHQQMGCSHQGGSEPRGDRGRVEMRPPAVGR
jgi:hypothetical protein